MTMRLSTAVRTALAQAIITELGSGATGKFYSGAMPTDLGTPGGALLAAVTFGSVIGTAGSGAIDFDEAVTQSNGSHVSGTPTFFRLSKSGGTAVLDIDLGGSAPTLTWSGSIVTGQNVSLSAVTLTAPHATA